MRRGDVDSIRSSAPVVGPSSGVYDERRLNKQPTTTPSQHLQPRPVYVRVPSANDTDQTADSFGIEPGTLELVQVHQRAWRHPPLTPLPITTLNEAPILQEFTRNWRVLRLTEPPPPSRPSVPLELSLLQNYDPKPPMREATFPSTIQIPRCMQARTAIEEATALLITPHIRFALGSVEPLYCRLGVYDLQLGCRVTEEFAFTIPYPTIPSNSSITGASFPAAIQPPHALIYTLPNHAPQHLYLVLKVSKVLYGEADVAITPYQHPDKFQSEMEQHKLVERTIDCQRRLGRYRQPLAWGAIAYMEGSHRPMTMYRQRTTMSDEQRMTVIMDAVRGTYKEKVIPCFCEFDLERIDEQRLDEIKFGSTKSMEGESSLDLCDPFSILTPSDLSKSYCREVQPFGHPTVIPTYGLYGQGPFAMTYFNTLYLYPLHIDKCAFRNVVVCIQLVAHEVEFVCGIDHIDLQRAVIPACYQEGKIVSCVSTQVNYHQKNPQWETEVKLAIPEQVTLSHHLLLTIYHVHCKKLQPQQTQQELIGCAVIPLIRTDGTWFPDHSYTLPVIPPSGASKGSTTGGIISLTPGYVAIAREQLMACHSNSTFNGELIKNTTLTCRLRTLSSVRSQDSAVAAILEPFQSTPIPRVSSPTTLIDDLVGLRQAHTATVRHFFFPLARFVLAHLRFGSMMVRVAAFRALLSVLEKASWTGVPRSQGGSSLPVDVLQQFVFLVFDERVVESCASRIPMTSNLMATNLVDDKRPQSVVQALAVEWLRVLRDPSGHEEATDAKRMSLAFAHVLLQLVLKSMAMQRPSDPMINESPTNKKRSWSLLPLRPSHEDDLLIEDLLIELMRTTTSTSYGLLLQKEVNRSLAHVCRGFFLITTSTLPKRVIERYFTTWNTTSPLDVNVTVHLVFPFVQSLIEFELFPLVNGLYTARHGPWLARLIYERLFTIIESPVEDRIRSDALRLLRRMFVLQVYHSRYVTLEDQQQIALFYFPMITRVLSFTSDSKLLSDGILNESDRLYECRKELLICIAHILSTVAPSYLSWYYVPPISYPSVMLHPTALLVSFRKKFQEAQALEIETAIPSHAKDRSRRHSLVSQRVIPTINVLTTINPLDDVRIHACFSLVKQMIEVFLVEDAAWPTLLSPELMVREGVRSSLLDLEQHLKNRQSRHRITNIELPSEISRSTSTSSATNRPSTASPATTTSPTSSSFTSSTTTRNPPQKPLQRNWGKNYTATQRKSLGNSSSTDTTSHKLSLSMEGDDPLAGVIEYDSHVRNLYRIIARTALRTIQTAIDQFETVLKTIEAPYQIHEKQIEGTNGTMEQASMLLSGIVDLLLLLLHRVSTIDSLTISSIEEEDETNEHPSFLSEVFNYLQSFLLRFPKALVLSRIPGLVHFYDTRSIHLLVSLSSTARRLTVRHAATAFLCRLGLVSYDETGSFSLMKQSLVHVVCTNFYPSTTLPPLLSTEALRDAVELWRQYTFPDDAMITRAFELGFVELLNTLTNQIKVYGLWYDAITALNHTPLRPTSVIRDYEEIEDGLYRIVQSISPSWLVDIKSQWMNALIQLHLIREQYMEATCCQLEMLMYPNHHAIEILLQAREYAEKGFWFDQVVMINEQLLVLYRSQKLYPMYRQTLIHLDRALQAQADAEYQEQWTVTKPFVFYRVIYGGDCVSSHMSKCEFIYKRSKFMSLGEFVGDLKSMLRLQYPLCERVDIVGESKPFPLFTDHCNVIFMRVTTLEALTPSRFTYSTPFTLGTSSYGKLHEQLKRVTVLETSHGFPCSTTRQVVSVRHEVVQCPIENAMDDIRKRCGVLQLEIDKETRGQTDLKTLTMVLKGSVDTHVHGGIPQVIEAFLVKVDDMFPVLIDMDGKPMEDHKSREMRETLVDVLIEFLHLCSTCLLISRAAYKRKTVPTTQTNASHATQESNLGGLVGLHGSPHKSIPSTTGGLLVALGAGHGHITNTTISPSVGFLCDDDPTLSPLQQEFEKSFAMLIDAMLNTVCSSFSFSNQTPLVMLQEIQRRRNKVITSGPLMPPPPPTSIDRVNNNLPSPS